MRGNFIWCVVPPFRDHLFSLVIKLVRKYQRKPYVTVHTRKDYHLFPSLGENTKESFNLAFELAFHSLLLYPAGLLHILTRRAKRILQTAIYFKIFNPVNSQGSFVFLLTTLSVPEHYKTIEKGIKTYLPRRPLLRRNPCPPLHCRI